MCNACSVGLTMLPSELMDAAFCVLLYLILDYVLCARFFVPKIPEEPAPYPLTSSADRLWSPASFRRCCLTTTRTDHGHLATACQQIWGQPD